MPPATCHPLVDPRYPRAGRGVGRWARAVSAGLRKCYPPARSAPSTSRARGRYRETPQAHSGGSARRQRRRGGQSQSNIRPGHADGLLSGRGSTPPEETSRPSGARVRPYRARRGLGRVSRVSAPSAALCAGLHRHGLKLTATCATRAERHRRGDPRRRRGRTGRRPYAQRVAIETALVGPRRRIGARHLGEWRQGERDTCLARWKKSRQCGSGEARSGVDAARACISRRGAAEARVAARFVVARRGSGRHGELNRPRRANASERKHA